MGINLFEFMARALFLLWCIPKPSEGTFRGKLSKNQKAQAIPKQD